MILCYCCERRIGHSIDPCQYSDDYCPECILCQTHCQCPQAAIIVQTESKDEERRGLATPRLAQRAERQPQGAPKDAEYSSIPHQPKESPNKAKMPI